MADRKGRIAVEFMGHTIVMDMPPRAPHAELLTIDLRRMDEILMEIRLLVVWSGDLIQLIQEDK
ncbi:unnamed protein product, partial [marine sediment metagenome]